MFPISQPTGQKHPYLLKSKYFVLPNAMGSLIQQVIIFLNKLLF